MQSFLLILYPPRWYFPPSFYLTFFFLLLFSSSSSTSTSTSTSTFSSSSSTPFMAFHLVCPVVEERVWQSVLRQTDHRWGQTHVQHTHIGDHQRYCMHCTALHCTSNRTTYLDLKEKQEKIPRTLPSLITLHSSHLNDLILSDRSPTIKLSSPPPLPPTYTYTHPHTHTHLPLIPSHPILPSSHPSPQHTQISIPPLRSMRWRNLLCSEILNSL